MSGLYKHAIDIITSGQEYLTSYPEYNPLASMHAQ